MERGDPLTTGCMRQPAVWFPTVLTGTGTEVFTKRLVASLQQRGIRSEITWLPLRAEYAPWTTEMPAPPEWATVAHVSTWLPARFLPNRLPVVATIHHSMHHADVRRYKGFARSMYHRWWIAPNERRVLRRASQVVAVSQFVAETARQTLLDVPMEVIVNGVDTDKFCPGSLPRKARETFRVLYVGGWKILKGVDRLAPIMYALGQGFQLDYTGGDAAASDKPQMPTNMRDIGRLDGGNAVVAAMQNADALLLSSRSEGLPLVGVEAMACGLPVVAARGSSLGEVVEDGVTGMLCKHGDVAEFATALRRLASDPSLHAAYSQAARARAVAHFSLTTMVEAYIDVYRRVSAS